ncbi:8-oxo-dGDP phosphatase NUDT18 [Zootoca vivipara]|uniref:8-oxo-dGDP phosphatase NUDT18 n=1 Tax=Zootoca vivipara TaxID=8524 RepID=UPI00293BFF3A|nr:8-oxo-dGDP phosphatase NUDT18 [Zootoca vivipara]
MPREQARASESLSACRVPHALPSPAFAASSAPLARMSSLESGVGVAAEDEEVAAVLGGGGWPVVAPQGRELEPARLRRNTCYIVLAVLLNEEKEVLMMQEAKPQCHGRWYLPAGRMEPRETIVEAMRREVQEETGLQCQPLTLLAVEERGPAWIRFVFLARPTGGALKTLQEADAESLQAQWWNRETPFLPLRSRDILPLIELALRYQASPAHPRLLPVQLPSTFICQRLLLVCVGSSGDLWVLQGTTGAPCLPLATSGLAPSQLGHRLLVAIRHLLQDSLPHPQVPVRIKGLLGVQHLGKEPGQSDGICFNIMAAVGDKGRWPNETPPELQSGAFLWRKVEDEALRSRILQRLDEESFVPIHS